MTLPVPRSCRDGHNPSSVGNTAHNCKGAALCICTGLIKQQDEGKYCFKVYFGRQVSRRFMLPIGVLHAFYITTIGYKLEQLPLCILLPCPVDWHCPARVNSQIDKLNAYGAWTLKRTRHGD